MSEEEKKAIDDLFALTHINGYIDLYTQKEAKIHTLDLSKWQNGVKVLLNLIEKQQKEIEEYKKFKKDIVGKIMFWDKEELPDNEAIISVLDTFVAEVSRLEDLEDRKIEAEIGIIEEKRDKYWKNKIREIIEHYNNELEHIKNGEEFENEKPMYYWGKVALENLLEEN